MAKQKIVIKVSMPCDKSRSKAMTLAARADGVISMAITGDAREKLELVGDGVDPVRLVSCLRRKVGHAEILQVEEMKDKKPEEKKPQEPKPPQPVAVHPCPPPQHCYSGGYPYYRHPPPPPQPVAVHPCPPPQHCYSGGYPYYRHPPPPPMVICDEPSGCSIM